MGAGMEHPVAAAEKVLATLTDLVNQTEPADRLRFTAALSNGSDLYAFRYAVNDQRQHALLPGIGRRHRHRFRAARSRHKNWIAVPENHVVVACAGERARILPLFHRHQEAAE